MSLLHIFIFLSHWGCSPNIQLYFSKPLRLLCILVCFIVCDSSFFLLCALLSLIVVHYARDCSCIVCTECMCVDEWASEWSHAKILYWTDWWLREAISIKGKACIVWLFMCAELGRERFLCDIRYCRPPVKWKACIVWLFMCIELEVPFWVCDSR